MSRAFVAQPQSISQQGKVQQRVAHTTLSPFRQFSGRDYAASVLSQSFTTTCDARTEQDTGEEREEYNLPPLMSKQGAVATRHKEHVSCRAVSPAFLPVCRRRLCMRLIQSAVFTPGRSSMRPSTSPGRPDTLEGRRHAASARYDLSDSGEGLRRQSKQWGEHRQRHLEVIGRCRPTCRKQLRLRSTSRSTGALSFSGRKVEGNRSAENYLALCETAILLALTSRN